MATDIIARGMITEYKSGTNIDFKENEDGSVTISASGDVSSEDTVARDTIDNHKHDKNNPHNVTAEQVGLGNVDNTADLDKPISNATQAELDEKAEKVHTHLVEEITDFPDSLPANGGNADTVNNHTVDSDVPDNAVFTDTTNSDVSAAGNPVQIDGLQGGVPFSEITVSGKNLIGIAQAKAIIGDSTSGYSVINNASSRSIIQKLQPNTTYHIKKYDSGNRFRIVMFNNEPTNAADTTAIQLIYNSDGSVSDYTLTTGEDHLWMVLATNYAESGEAVEPIAQLEFGDTATAYAPPIAGRELTVGVCGKNLIPYPYYDGNSKTQNGISFTVNSDGTVTANGTSTDIAYFYIAMYAKIVKKGVRYAISGCPEGANVDTYRIYINERKSDGASNGIFIADFNDNKSFTVSDNCDSIHIAIQIRSGVTVDNLVFRPQLELGDTATPYEPYHGSTTTITPTSNPYVIPNDIRQQEGLNVVGVSEGEISVTGVRKNAAIKKIWDEMGMDLLFDGVTSADNPAVVDLANYKFVEIHHIMIANEKTYPSNIRLSLDSYLSSASTIITSIHGSSINTIHTEEGTVSSVYAISAAGNNMNNTKIYGIK